MIWVIIITAVLLAVVFWSNRLFDRKQAASNASKWMPLAPLIAGQVKGNGLQGTYRGRPVTALIDVNNALYSLYGDPREAKSSWIYALTLGAGVPHYGKSWEVDCTGTEPRHLGGDEATWRQVLAGVDAEAWRAARFDHFSYRAGKGELSGSFRLETITLESDIKDVMAAAKSPPPPPPEAFAAHLDFLARMAEVNETVNPPK